MTFMEPIAMLIGINEKYHAESVKKGRLDFKNFTRLSVFGSTYSIVKQVYYL
jgi:hypothetical protein